MTKKPTKAKAKAKAADTVMTGDEFRAALEKLYGTPQCQSAFSRLISVSDRAVRSWISEQSEVPKVVALLVSLMLKTKTKPEDLKA